MKILILMAILLLFPATSYAGGICRQNICAPRIQQFNTVEQFNVLQKNVEFDADYFVGYDGYYDTVNELNAREYSTDKDILLQKDEQLNRIIGLLETLINQKTGGTAPLPIPAPQPSDPPENIPDWTEVDPPADDDGWEKPEEPAIGDEGLNVLTYNIFKNSCAKCHSEDNPEGGLSLVGGEGELMNLSLAQRVLVYDHTAGIDLARRQKKLMPLGKSPLSDADVETLRLWMIDKAEQINNE